MAYMKMFIVLLFVAMASLVKADITATAFEPGSQHQKKLFTYRESLPTNPKNYQVKGTYSGLDGSELVVEKMEVKDGNLFQYSVNQRQVKEDGLLEVRSGKLNFSYTAEGKTATSTEDAPKNLVVGLSLVPFIEAHWAEIMKGESIPFRYAVLDRRETVGFKVFKTEESKRGDIATVTIKMKPTSFVIAALVDPVLLTFSTKDHELIEIVGRTLPKKSVKGEWQDQDPEMLFAKDRRS